MPTNEQTKIELPPVNIHCTDIVHSVFSRSVGACYEDFSCTYSRQHGRLYIARNALLYFSNLFGFERRLCMLMSEITDIKIYRSTSIWISMMDGEELVFRSIVKRERVVELVQKLLIVARRQAISALAQENFYSPPLDEVDTSPTVASRERVQSEMSREVSFDTDVNEYHPVSSTISADRKFSTGELSCDSTCTENLLNAWSSEKKVVQDTFGHKAIDDMKLHCSLSEFYDMFLDDEATFSIPDYQQGEVGDKNISTTHWMLDDDNYMTRSIEFTHPIPNSFGIGPSSTIATKRQRIRRFGEFGIIMQTETRVTDVPAADAFHVVDGWIVEADGDSTTVTFTVLHDTVFTKRTMLKRVIQASSASEMKKWYNGYAANVSTRVNRSRSRSNESALLPSRNESTGGQEHQGFKIDRSLKIMVVLILVMLVGISGCCVYLVTRLTELQTQLAVLVQQDHRRYQTSLSQSCDEKSST